MKKVAIAIAGLLAVGVVALIAVYGLAVRYTEGLLVKQWEAPTPQLQVSTDPEVIAHGQHLAQYVLMCAQCHGEDLGGMDPYIEAGGVVTVNTPNLTRGEGSVILDYTPADMARIIRYGVRPDGTATAIMPVQNFTGISDTDLTAVVSYLTTLKPVDRRPPESVFQPLGRVLWYFGVMDLQMTGKIDLSPNRPATTPTEPVAHGEYLAELSGCLDCHGATLSGGPVPGAPPDMAIPKNITLHATGLQGWTRADFDKALRAGTGKDGTPLDKFMPWQSYAGLSVGEMDALWAYIQQVQPAEFGNR